jgi:hypothetical protein
VATTSTGYPGKKRTGIGGISLERVQHEANDAVVSHEVEDNPHSLYAHKEKANTFTKGEQIILIEATGSRGLAIKRFSSGQTGFPLEVLNESGARMAGIGPDGGTFSHYNPGSHTIQKFANTTDSVALWIVDSTGKIEWGPGGAAARDVALWRESADRLRLDDLFYVVRALAGDFAIATRVDGDAVGRLAITADGQIELGDGALSRDIRIKRESSGILSIRNNADTAYEDLKVDNLVAATGVTVGGTAVSLVGHTHTLDNLSDVDAITSRDVGDVLAWDGTQWEPTPPGGGGAASITEVEIDFGAAPSHGKSFTIVDGSIAPTDQIIVQQSFAAATSKSQDEKEMDPLILRAVAGTGDFTVFVSGTEGRLYGAFKLNYMKG